MRTTACIVAECGDGLLFIGEEECDGGAIDNGQCESCSLVCDAGFLNCDGAPSCEIDGSIDDGNCGTCDNICSGACSESLCTLKFGADMEFNSAVDISPNNLLGNKVTVEQAMTVTHLAVIGKAGGAQVKMALYADLGGDPGALVVGTDAIALEVGAQHIDVEDTPIASGDYWLMATFDVQGHVGHLFGGDPEVEVKYISLSFASPLPDPFGPVVTYMGGLFNFYVVGYAD